MAGFFPLAVCAVAFHLCLLLCSSSSLRVAPESSRSSSPARHGGGKRIRTAYHFQPAKNWQNGKEDRSWIVLITVNYCSSQFMFAKSI